MEIIIFIKKNHYIIFNWINNGIANESLQKYNNLIEKDEKIYCAYLRIFTIYKF